MNEWETFVPLLDNTTQINIKNKAANQPYSYFFAIFATSLLLLKREV